MTNVQKGELDNLRADVFIGQKRLFATMEVLFDALEDMSIALGIDPPSRSTLDQLRAGVIEE